MSLDTALLGLASTSITVTPLSTHNAWGQPVFSTGTQTYTARVEYGPRLIVNAEGRQEVAAATVYVMSSSAVIGLHDRVVLPNDTAPRLIRVDRVDDEQGQHHLQLMIG